MHSAILSIVSLWVMILIIPPPAWGQSQRSQGLSLRIQEIQEDQPAYALRVQYPQLQYFSKPKVQKKVNKVIYQRAGSLIASFKKDVKFFGRGLPRGSPQLPKSTLDIRFRPVQDNARLLSFVWEGSTYFPGTAHRRPFFTTLNFDLKRGRQLQLKDLFRKGKPYLETLAALSQKKMRRLITDGVTRENWLQKGAGPKQDNFQDFVLDPGGLVILFKPNQVAPYAAGPQRVLLPYPKLNSILRPRYLPKN